MNEIENLLLNMSAGLLPEDLQEKEVELLENKYGRNWFTQLGYNLKEYRLPKNLHNEWTKGRNDF